MIEKVEEQLNNDEARSLHIEIEDVDRDSLHTMPLSIIPLETKALKNARLIKNPQLESVIELFSGKKTGSGQMHIGMVEKEFGPNRGGSSSDMAILRALGKLHSYDVYSMRVSLRELGIKVNDINALKLSEAKINKLTSYMKGFTRPLILDIYGKDHVELQSFEDVVRLFDSPDVKHAQAKLKMMAEKLDITPRELPGFLEDYGDVYLSLSYYKECLDEIEPTIKNFMESIQEIKEHLILKQDQNIMKNCNKVMTVINNLLKSLTNRFERFEESTHDMWDNVSGERFRKVESLIKSYHTTIGGELCSLSVKMDAWNDLFPSRSTGGPNRYAEFIMTDMRQGIDKIMEIEQSAPKLPKQQPALSTASSNEGVS